MSKNNIEYVEVDDWDNLRYTINKYFAHWPNYIFRGQGQDNWFLETTLSRALKKLKNKDLENYSAEHLNRFKLEIRGRRGDNPKDLTENELWALGQHFGLYTPLLDWTESPWVAIFFAVTSIEKSETGKRAIWALCVDNIEQTNFSYKSKRTKAAKKMEVELVIPNIDENIRLVNQRGLFTKIHLDNNIENWVENADDGDKSVTLFKITFPDKLKDKIMMYLNLMNINHSSLFPDLYGSSKFTNQRLLQSDVLKELQQKDWDSETDDEE